ncbi:MAG: permease-like cell division protein FtsX [Bacillota bacterium]|nr:permease-like cell division protein FtsX [Bacillota bacterium]
MRISSLGYAFRQAFTQIFRNKAMTLASLFSITCMLLILGLVFLVVVNLNLMAETAKNQFDTIQIYLLEETDREQAEEMIEELSDMPQVGAAVYLSKDEAMEEFRVRWGDNAYLLDNLSENPLPNSIRVTVLDLEGAGEVVERARGFSGVEDIKYYQDTVEKLLKIAEMIQTGALVVIGFLIIVSVVVVSNTVKLTVLAREEEISIMKYVGATNWFIRGPFLVEGLLIGLLAAVLSTAAVGFLYYELTETFGQEAFLLFSTALVPARHMIINMGWIFAALGLGIGSVGSIRSMRRFLDT